MVCKYKLRPPISEMVEYLNESYGHLWGCDPPMYDAFTEVESSVQKGPTCYAFSHNNFPLGCPTRILRHKEGF